MTEAQLAKAKEIQSDLEKQQRDIETLEKLMWYGQTKSLVVRAIKRFVFKLHYSYGAVSFDCNLSKDELKALADYKSKKFQN